MIPSGIILMWSGSVASIPTGFVLCNGANGSPDLRDRFVVGAGTTYDPDDNGGSVNHTHPFTGDGHTHTIPGGLEIAEGEGYTYDTASEVAAGTTDNGSSLPPYYALAYIMKT
jgi:hypothetical protein